MRHALFTMPACAALSLLLGACGTQTPVPTLPVTSTADTGTGSLRAVLDSAKDGDVITFAVPGTVTLQSPLVITKDVTIQAAGVTLDAAGKGRLLDVRAEAEVTLDGVTLTNGTGAPEPVAAALSLHPQATLFTTGGLINNSGQLTLTGATLSGGVANNGGAVYNRPGATLVVRDSTFKDNKALGFTLSTQEHGMGGAINNAGTLRIESGTFTGNTAEGGGGAVFNSGALTVSGGTFSSNSSVRAGGGIRNAKGSVFNQTGGSLSGNAPDNIFAVTEANTGEARDFVFRSAWSVDAPAAVQRGGTLKEAVVGAPATLNPFLNAQTNTLFSFISDSGLLISDPVTDEFLPYMAQSYTISPDGLTWDFKLRPDLTWSDGQPITPDDFVMTARIHQDQAVGSNSFDSLRGLTVSRTGADSVRIVFARRSATAALAAAFQPWPAHIFGAAYTTGGAAAVRALWPATASPESIVVSGPFKLQSRTASGAVLVRNPAYGEWAVDAAGQPLPYLDRVEVAQLGTSDNPVDAYLAGRIDLFAPGNAQQVVALRTVPGTVLRENYSPTASSTWIAFNWNRASDPEKQRLFRATAFRQAMSHVVDRPRMIQEVLGGVGSPAYTSVYPVFKDWLSPSVPKFDFNVAEARRLLGTLGYTQANTDGYLVNSAGRVLEFNLMTNAGNSSREAYARLFADGARQAGVKVNVTLLDFNTVINTMTATGTDRPFDAVLLGLSGGSGIYPLGVNVVPCSGNLHVYNLSGACLMDWETQMQALFEQGQQELDRNKRIMIAQQIQNIEGQHQPFIHLVSPGAYAAWRASVRGQFPTEIADASRGTRLRALTWIQK